MEYKAVSSTFRRNNGVRRDTLQNPQGSLKSIADTSLLLLRTYERDNNSAEAWAISRPMTSFPAY